MDGPWVMSTGPAVGLKRKSMSLNGDMLMKDAHGGGLDLGVFRRESFSKEERKELRKRLRLHLEQVQGVTFKILARQDELLKRTAVVYPDTHGSRGLNGSVVKEVKLIPSTILEDAPSGISEREARLARQPSVVVSSEALGCTPGVAGKEKRTPKANQFIVNSEFVSGKDKMSSVEKMKQKSAIGAKRIGQAKTEVGNLKRQKLEMARIKRFADIMKLCGSLLKKLATNKHSWVFNEPVDAVKLGLHDYHKVIKRPMDLGTIKRTLEGGQYASPTDFADDVRLTFTNAMTYNPKGHFVYAMAETLLGIFEERWKVIDEKLQEDRMKMKGEDDFLAGDGQGPTEEFQDIKEHLRSLEDKIQVLTKSGNRHGGGRAVARPKPRPDDVDKRAMTFDEKRKLSVSLQNLDPNMLEEIVQIMKKRNPTLSQNDEEIEVDIDSLNNDTLWELDRFVSDCMQTKGKPKRKIASKVPADPVHEVAELEVGAPAGSPNMNLKVEELGDEEIEIDIDSAPAQSPLNMLNNEATAAVSSSSGSSSSDSGSSSSDSDSASSSGSESDGEDALRVGSATKSDDIKSDVVQCVSSPVKTTVASHQGDSREEALPERQVSPDKLLRAAMLRGRFADIIVKAQEKTLPPNKNEKLDPERLRREREDMERRQKEEKARLHAEAKAAELARKRAEVEAANEARRKREAEREAARLQLQQMEKTVEIDENSEILKDLEMLRAVSLDHHLSSSGEDGSPDADSPDGMAIFALQGRNPLERLGLFMKDDDADEHDGFETQETIIVTEEDNGDVEEGEID